MLAYREEAFPDGPPTSWNVLLDPKFKGRVAIYNDGIGMHFPAVIAGGGTYADIPDNMQPAWDWFTKLKANSPLLGEDPDFTAWFQNGEIDVACTISSNAREARNNGIKVDWTVPTEGAKMDTDCLWIPKGLPEGDLYWTKQYINYAISPEGQQAWLDAARPSRRRARPQAAGRPRRRPVLPDDGGAVRQADLRAAEGAGRAPVGVVRQGQGDHAELIGHLDSASARSRPRVKRGTSG